MVFGTFEWWLRSNIPPKLTQFLTITPIWVAIDPNVWMDSIHKKQPLHATTNAGRTYTDPTGQVIYTFSKNPEKTYAKFLDEFEDDDLTGSPPEKLVVRSIGVPKQTKSKLTFSDNNPVKSFVRNSPPNSK